MKVGSLFSGIGGFDRGFEQAGLAVKWQVEIDADCNRVLERHWPGVTRYKDVRDVGKLEPVDVIAGGFPCQDLSVAGKRKGLAGERSGLWFEFLRVIELNRPRYVCIENVPGLLSSGERRDFAIILRGLVECGYCVAWRVLDAQFWGIAQRRRRVFIVGSLGDGSCAEILFNGESLCGDLTPRREARAGVTPILEAGARTNGDGRRDGDGIGIEGDPMFTLQSGKQHAVAATLDQRGRGPTDAVMMNLQVARPLANSRTTNHYDESQQTYVTHALRSEGVDASEDGTGRGTPLVIAEAVDVRNLRMQPDGTSGTLQHKKSGGYSLNYQNPVCLSSVDLQNTRLGGDVVGALDTTRPSRGGGQAVMAFTERTRSEGRTFEAQEDLAYSLANNAAGGNTHGSKVAGHFGVRRLTPRECERLMGLPDDYTRWDAGGREISDSARYRMLGNSIVIPVAKWIGERLMKA